MHPSSPMNQCRLRACILGAIGFCSFFLFLYMHPNLFNTQDVEKAMKQYNCQNDAILCSDVNKSVSVKSSELPELRKIFYSLASTVEFKCTAEQRFGRQGDGGYEVCMSPGIRPNNKSCLVYSFGINNEWSFDEDLARYGCEVHSFDPSMGMDDHLHSPNVNFHRLGLWGSDIKNSQGWKLERLSTIRKRLGHQRRLIDVLKVDVEAAEWPFLRDVLYNDGDGGLSRVKQLLIELHTPKFIPTPMTASAFAEINAYMLTLRQEQEFQVYKNVQRNNCCGRFSPLMPAGIPERCCHEVFLFNARLLYRT